MDNDELLVKIKDMFDTKVDGVKDVFDIKVNEVKVLVENLETKIQIVAEGHDILNRKIDAIDRKVDAGLDTLNRKIDAVDRKVDGIKNEMAIIKEYVIGVDTKLNEHEIILKRVK